MAVKLFLHFINQTSSTSDVAWLLYDTATQEVVGEGAQPLQAIAQLVSQKDKQHRPVVLLAAEQILMTSVAVPTKQKNQISQAVPFLVEESLAVDVEQSHFAIDYQVRDGKVSVAVIAQDKLRGLLELLEQSGFKPSYLSSDVLFCPYQKQHWNLTLGGQRALLRYGETQAGAIEIDNVALLLNACLDAQDQDVLAQLQEIQVYGSEDDKTELLLSQLENEVSHLAQLKIKSYQSGHSFLEDAAVAYLANKHYDIDLLQGEFKVSAEAKSQLMPLRWLAYAASFWFVLQLLLSLGEGLYLQQQSNALLVEARNHYRENFSQSKKEFPMSRMVRVVKSRAIGGGETSQSSFIGLFSQLAPVTKSVISNGLNLQTLSFSQARKELVLDVLAPSYEQLDALQQGLSNINLQAEITSVNSDGDNAVRGRVKIKST